MNVISLLCTLVICLTVIGLPYVLSIYPITIKIVNKAEYETLVTPSNTVPETEVATTNDKPEHDKTQEIKNMDSVIAAVNEMFGVTVESDVNEKE